MAKHSRLVERLRALRELSGLTNVKIAERSKTYVFPGAAKRHPLNDRSIGDWLRGDHVPSEEGLRVLVGVMQVAAADRRPPIERPDPELMKGVAEGSWLDWLAEARERDGRRPAPPEDGSRWEGIIRAAKIWPDAEGAAELRDQALAALRQLEGERRKAVEAALADDPWLDEELPERTVRRVSELVGYLSGAPLEFSAVEAFLLTVAPLLYHTRWAQTAVEAHSAVDPMRLEPEPDCDFEFFRSGDQQRRLVERARRIPAAEDPDRRAICWWLFHRWLDQSASGQPATVSLELAPPLEQQLKQLLPVFRLSPGKLKDWRLRDQPEEWPGGQRLRTRLVALILGLAHTMAIEPGSLSSTLVEHLGIDHQVDLADLRRTLRASSWVRTPTALRLDAECRHEAVYEVLTEHVTRMSEMLRTAREAAARETAVAPLLGLPERSSDEDVTPATRPDGRPEFVVPTTKFRLDETRVRELLMGEQLYRDRSLAIRELYQNALDACRYSQAWRRYLLVKNGGPRDWSWPGKIEFRQWEEGGQHFLSCRDNGVGMGEAELREVFSQAGIRFADRREFAVERARWEAEGIHIHPNSRFGIGVMSYFMLADRIEVTTRRMNPGGERLPLVKVAIAGPGHLFRVETLTGPDDDGREEGTEVKLLLRDGAKAPSCVATLRALLGIAEFETTAQYGEEEPERWQPFEFQPRRRHPAREDSIEAYGRLQHGAPSENGQVVWCERGGALLVDGIYVRCENQRGVLTAMVKNSDPRGAVINLTGSFSPKLSVDRMSVLQDVSERAELLLQQATSDLRKPESLLEYQWVLNVFENNPGIADVIADTAISAGLPTRIGSYDTTVDATGIIKLDGQLIRKSAQSNTDYRRRVMNTPPHLLLWRLLALKKERTDGPDRQPLLPALPSDDLLITLAGYTTTYGSFPPEISPPSAWRAAIHLGIDSTNVIRRLAKLGFSVTKCEKLLPPTHLDSADLTLINLAEKPLRRSNHSYEYATLVVASAQLDIPMTQVARRLAELGFDSAYVAPSGRADGTDVRLIGNLGTDPTKSNARFLKIGEPVSALYVLLAAEATGLTPSSAANRLRRLGLTVPDFDTTVADLRAVPLPVLQAMKQLLTRGQQSQTGQMCREALRAGCQPRDIARTLAKFGIDAEKQPPEQLTDTDESLLHSLPSSVDYAGPHDLIRASLRSELTTQNAAARFEAMGFRTCDAAHIPSTPEAKDREVLQALSGALLGSTVNLRELAIIVARTGYSPTEVTQRLAKFQIDVEYTPATDHHIDPELIPPRLPAPATTGIIKVPLPLILNYADDTGITPAKIGSHLRSLGCSVPQIRELSPEEEALIGKNSTRERLDLQRPLTLSDLLVGAVRAGMTAHEAAARFDELGCRFEFPDLDTELQRLLPLVPRMSDHRP
ncbi:wHTH domain-containing protein [Amycolatopsis sp. NPDC003861]